MKYIIKLKLILKIQKHLKALTNHNQVYTVMKKKHFMKDNINNFKLKMVMEA